MKTPNLKKRRRRRRRRRGNVFNGAVCGWEEKSRR
jgi:hypothetical protein